MKNDLKKSKAKKVSKDLKVVHSIENVDEANLVVRQVEEPITVKEAVSDEHNKKIALTSAQQIHDEVSKNWFFPEHMAAKWKIGLDVCIKILDHLKLFKVIYERINPRTKQKEYKVTLSLEDRLILIEDDIEFYDVKLKILIKEAEKLKEQINLNKVQS